MYMIFFYQRKLLTAPPLNVELGVDGADGFCELLHLGLGTAVQIFKGLDPRPV